MGTPEGEVTRLLHAWGSGDRSVEDRLFELVLPDLRKLAETMMRRERPDHSLQPTALLNEAYCRLLTAREREWRNRSHFFAIPARALRRLLVQRARRRLQEFLLGRDEQLELALAVDGLLDDMAPAHGSWCSIVELKFFLGFTDEEAAEVLGLPLRSLQRQFGDARRWLYEKLKSCQAKPITTSS